MDANRIVTRGSFASFPQFPTEIRHKIWHEVARVPRNIDLWAIPTNLPRCSKCRQIIHRHMSVSQPPAILHVSSESRAIGLRYYELAFGTKHETQYDIEITTPSRIYVNWERDVIVPMAVDDSGQTFDWSHNFYANPDFAIQNIAINITDRPLPAEHVFALPLRNIFLYEREPSRLKHNFIIPHQFTLEIVDLEDAKRQNLSIREDAEKNHWLHERRAEIYQRHNALLKTQMSWNRSGKARHAAGGWPARALLNRLPCPEVHLAHTKINGRWTL